MNRVKYHSVRTVLFGAGVGFGAAAACFGATGCLIIGLLLAEDEDLFKDFPDLATAKAWATEKLERLSTEFTRHYQMEVAVKELRQIIK